MTDIIKINDSDKEKYLDLLLLADPDKKLVREYLKNSDMFGVFKNDIIVCEAVITKIDDNVCELKNLATIKKEQGMGYAKRLLQYILDYYSDKYEKMIVGTTENNIPFYVKCGFDKYYSTCKNFFVSNYPTPIFDGNLECIDMYYYFANLEKYKKITYEIEKICEDDREKINKILEEEWESTNIIIRGEVIDGKKLDGFVAKSKGDIVGLITYMISGNECEIVSLNSFKENNGIGTNLILKVKELAKEKNLKRIKLVTTNNNIAALEFYQKKGFSFSKIYNNSIEVSRKLKPQIPLYADNGLPIKDEIEFEMML